MCDSEVSAEVVDISWIEDNVDDGFQLKQRM